MSVHEKFNDVNLSVSEIGALATILEEWFDGQDWRNMNSQLVERASLAIGVLARAATVAMSKMNVLENALAEAEFSEPGEWEFSEDTPGTQP